MKTLESVQTRYVSPESKLRTHHFSNILNRAVPLFKTRYSPIPFLETLTALGNTGRAQSSCPETFCFCENPPECPNEVRVPRIEVDNTSLSQRTSKDLHATTLNKKKIVLDVRAEPEHNGCFVPVCNGCFTTTQRQPQLEWTTPATEKLVCTRECDQSKVHTLLSRDIHCHCDCTVPRLAQ